MPNKAELIVEDRKIQVSNLDKVLYPKVGFTKGQVIDYYIRVAPVLLPHLKDRPLTMKRYPNGVEGEFFYEKNCPSHRPKWVQTAKVWSEGNQRIMNYCLVQRSADARLGRKPGRSRAAHVALAQKQHRTSDNDGVRSRSRRAGRHRPMLPGRALAARFVRQNEIEVVRENERLKGLASVRAAQYGSYLRSRPRIYRAHLHSISNTNMPIG